MPLRRRLSGLVKGRDDRRSSNLVGGGDGSLSVNLTSVEEQEEDGDLAAALTASFQDELSRLRCDLAQALLNAKDSQQEIIALKRSCEDQIAHMEEEAVQMRARLTSLEFSNKLYGSKNEEQAEMIAKLKEENLGLLNMLETRDRIHADEMRALQYQHGQTIQEMHNSAKELNQNPDLVAQEIRGRKVNAAEKREQFELQLAKSTARISELSSQLQDRTAELETLRGLLDMAMTENRLTSAALVELQSFFGGNTTPRLVLTIEHFRRLYAAEVLSTSAENERYLRDSSNQLVINTRIDMPMSIEELGRFIRGLRNEEASFPQIVIETCAVCERHKFAAANSSVTPKELNEFLPEFRDSVCCGRSICSACLKESVLRAIQEGWWHSLDSQQWIRCPVEDCNGSLINAHEGSLISLLNKLQVPNADFHLTRYKRANSLRASLLTLDPRPSQDALTAAANLHNQLIDNGIMFDLFDPQFEPNQPDESGRIPPFSPGKIIICETDMESLCLPVFVKFFRRKQTPRECIICCESYYDVDVGTAEEWQSSTCGFHGPWMWDISIFPMSPMLRCEHEYDFCKSCFSSHLSTQLEQHGRHGCDRLTCPKACGRTLSTEEVLLFASPDTRQKFNHYIFLNYISSQPNFRWCLRDGCESGQLYDIDDETGEIHDPLIVCENCAFAMCFTHQLPWHEGLSCEQFNNQREHGDPDYADTQEYIRANTKTCPGANCGMNVLKDGGCFHMTCRSCGHEFCWECLADWRLISPEDGEYNRVAHNDGCWFLSHNTQPTQIAGNTIEAALRRRR
ncbi:uncharacterized protein PV09_07338 [Verruconis gallopava]|uniref:RBR-type E3 ubiquitin transferase n=1 Tax=Verruconis gallopava TaxID=253628 RepID=A0A0D2A4A7_9PEZI|nr:uncharacterized protein PV09_07338 [Verruconis gallopava]KIW01300.1 hypothetical protein PV09_07338 [Verruconis gallopava]